MDINKNNWERKMQIQNILVACKLNMIGINEADERMMGLLKQEKQTIKINNN